MECPYCGNDEYEEFEIGENKWGQRYFACMKCDYVGVPPKKDDKEKQDGA